jgi:hypothetical protein
VFVATSVLNTGWTSFGMGVILIVHWCSTTFNVSDNSETSDLVEILHLTELYQELDLVMNLDLDIRFHF